MLFLSLAAIIFLINKVIYKIAIPAFKKTLRPILFGLVLSVLINVTLAILTKIVGGDIKGHAALTSMTPTQIFIFVFIYASIAEEVLFRGFLMNILKPLKEKGIIILKRKLSLPVIVSAIAFGLAHLILITTGAGGFFLLRIVIFTTLLGLIAGYYQEKYDNNASAIIVHMSGNFPGVIGAFLMNLNM
jgi:membrane protease YdiL (CAAX protease family)